MNKFKDLKAEDKYILICCFFIFFVNGLYSMVFGVFIPIISEQYQLSDTMSGLLLSSHQGGNLIAGFIAGILPIYYGRKNSILFLSSFAILGFFVMIMTGNPMLLLMSFFFTGISRGSISNFNNKTVNDISNSDPVALNFLHSMFAVGALISPFLVVLAGQLFGDKGWKIVSLFIIVLIIISQVMFSKMKVTELSAPGEQPIKDYSFFKDSLFWNTVVILFFYICAEAAITGWLVKYFIDMNILAVSQAQMISSLLWFAILTGRLFCVFFGHRISRATLITAISIGMTVFYLILLNSSSIKMIIFSVLGLGFSMGGIYPTAMTIAGSSIKKYPMSLGWILIIGGIGGITMPIVTGALSQRFNIYFGMAAIVFAIVGMLLGVLWYSLVNVKKEEIL